MTPQEALAAKKTSAVMRSARKKLGLTQVSVAERLGISQSALSKMESAILIPSAPQWFEFCDLAGVSVDAILTGCIERNTPATLEQAPAEGGLKIPKAYRENRGSKVRAMIPFLTYFKEMMGEERLAEYFKAVKIDPDFFVDLDNQVNLGFSLDMVRHLISRGKFKKEDFPRLAGIVSRGQAHGSLHRQYASQQDWTTRVKTLIANSRYYECNFNYQVDELSENHVVISVTPEPHMRTIRYKDDPVLGDFIWEYKRYYFEQFANYEGGTSRRVGVAECRRDGERWIYTLRAAV